MFSGGIERYTSGVKWVNRTVVKTHKISNKTFTGEFIYSESFKP